MTTGYDAPGSQPPFVMRGLPGSGHAAMTPLAGEFRCEMLGYIAGGTPEAPVVLNLSTHREMVGGGRWLRDETVGPGYQRFGTLGYSTMDERFEWITQDAVNTETMIYLGEPRSGPSFPAQMRGAFTDQGVLGEQFVGQRITMTTVITIEDDDHHTLDMYMAAPGELEFLADRKRFSRTA